MATFDEMLTQSKATTGAAPPQGFDAMLAASKAAARPRMSEADAEGEHAVSSMTMGADEGALNLGAAAGAALQTARDEPPLPGQWSSLMKGPAGWKEYGDAVKAAQGRVYGAANDAAQQSQDEHRATLDRATADQPWASRKGDLKGMVGAIPFLPSLGAEKLGAAVTAKLAPEGAGLLARGAGAVAGRAVSGAIPGAAYGALGALGQSRATTMGRAGWDALKGAGGGAALGGGLGVGLAVAPGLVAGTGRALTRAREVGTDIVADAAGGVEARLAKSPLIGAALEHIGPTRKVLRAVEKGGKAAALARDLNAPPPEPMPAPAPPTPDQQVADLKARMATGDVPGGSARVEKTFANRPEMVKLAKGERAMAGAKTQALPPVAADLADLPEPLARTIEGMGGSPHQRALLIRLAREDLAAGGARAEALGGRGTVVEAPPAPAPKQGGTVGGRPSNVPPVKPAAPAVDPEAATRVRPGRTTAVDPGNEAAVNAARDRASRQAALVAEREAKLANKPASKPRKAPATPLEEMRAEKPPTGPSPDMQPGFTDGAKPSAAPALEAKAEESAGKVMQKRDGSTFTADDARKISEVRARIEAQGVRPTFNVRRGGSRFDHHANFVGDGGKQVIKSGLQAAMDDPNMLLALHPHMQDINTILAKPTAAKIAAFMEKVKLDPQVTRAAQALFRDVHLGSGGTPDSGDLR